MSLISLVITLIVVGRAALARQCLHSDGRQNQKNSQHCRGDLRRHLAAVRLWRSRSFK